MKIKNFLTILCLLISSNLSAVGGHKLKSPNGNLEAELIIEEDGIFLQLKEGETVLLDKSRIDLEIEGKGFASNKVYHSIKKYTSKSVKETIKAPFYRNPEFESEYQQSHTNLNNGVAIELRLFNEGLAYRFCTTGFKNKEYKIKNEIAEFNFSDNFVSYLPYSTNPKKPEAQAFQATYDVKPLSEQTTNNLAFLPAVVDAKKAKLTLMESDLESYPGMFIKPEGKSLKAWFAKYPKTFDYYTWRYQRYVTSTEDYIATCKGNRNFPWRIIAVSHDDTEMPVNNLVYALASPNRIGDTSWIKPGQVAWDWWNDWGVSGVDFAAGINMDTYKYYIDFAAKYGLSYIILDEGWFKPSVNDMLTVIPELNLPELIAYGKQKGVRIILWTIFNVLDDNLEKICKTYSDMGIAGFKADFLDRDDQEGVEMIYRIAEVCAKYHLMLDYHGIYKPTGINRTYPNIVNFESCFGMEEAKWTKHDEKDMPLYDVTFPFIRMQSGFVDFTPGGMRNATAKDFQPIYYNPLTMGTRCHQLAMYVIHDSPLTMLADNPTAYEQEPEYTRFIASIPVTYDETKIPMGKMGEYIVTARRKGNNWYVGGQTNWSERDLTLSFSFLPSGNFEAVIYKDGVNANKNACDYKVETLQVNNSTSLPIHLASGGGFAIRLIKNNE